MNSPLTNLRKTLRIICIKYGIECHLEVTFHHRLKPWKSRRKPGVQEEHENISFDFLGYTFRPRLSKNRWGKYFVNFTPAISNKSKKSIRQKVRSWKLQLKAEKDIKDLSNMFNPVIQGWINYYGKFYKSEMYSALRHVNKALIMWARKKV